MEVITSMKCTACLEVLPMEAFRFHTRDMRYCTQCRHCESDAAMERQRRRAAANAIWTQAEVDLLHERYEASGSAGVMPYLPGRTRRQINNKAQHEGLHYSGRVVSGSPTKDDEAWAVPAHDYRPEDLALRQWGGLGTTVPELGMPVGVLSPSLGLVLGVAA